MIQRPRVSKLESISRRVALVLAVLVLLGAPGAAVGQAIEEGASYGYFRTLEGSATLFEGSNGERAEVVPNQPVLVGDRLWVAPSSRVEVALPDLNLLRLAGNSEVVFHRLAFSADSGDRATVLELRQGEAQFAVRGEGAETAPRIDTSNATTYFHQAGSYRISATATGWTRILVRDGYAEVITERGSAIARSGEQVVVSGERWPVVAVEVADYQDSLERWAEDLDAAAYAALQRAPDEIAPELAYAAAPLEGNGSWVEVGARRAWRPFVSVGWRPYGAGEWVWTPSGYAWVDYEPWGWVTAHYGTWSLAPGFGWVWYPGVSFAPAWVYWYWGPSYVGWVPVGYYTQHYYGLGLDLGFGFRFGVYGWAGGAAHYYADWTFCDLSLFGSRGARHGFIPGRTLEARYGDRALAAGIVTTDTRQLPRMRELEAGRVREILERRGRADGGGRPLPDVTAFVERRRALPAEVVKAVSADGRGGAVIPAVGRRSTGRKLMEDRPAGGGGLIRRTAPPAASSAGRTEASSGTHRGLEVKPRTLTGSAVGTAWRPGLDTLPRVRPAAPDAYRSDRDAADRSGWRSGTPTTRETPPTTYRDTRREPAGTTALSPWRGSPREDAWRSTEDRARVPQVPSERGGYGREAYGRPAASAGAYPRGPYEGSRPSIVRRVIEQLRSYSSTGSARQLSRPWSRTPGSSAPSRPSSSGVARPVESRSHSAVSTAAPPAPRSRVRSGGVTSSRSRAARPPARPAPSKPPARRPPHRGPHRG